MSHDRYFVSKTANKIWEIVDHKIKEFKGGYEEWVQWKERMAKLAANEKNAGKNLNPDKKERQQEKIIAEKKEPIVEKSTEKNNSAPINKELKKELQRLQKQFQQLEEKLASLKTRQKELEAALASPEIYGNKSKFLETESAYNKTSGEIASLNVEYEKVFEKIMEAEG